MIRSEREIVGQRKIKLDAIDDKKKGSQSSRNRISVARKNEISSAGLSLAARVPQSVKQ